MATRTIIIDANVIDQINRGNRQVAHKLTDLLDKGHKVYVSTQAHAELTHQPGKKISGVGPGRAQTAAANVMMLEQLGITKPPASKLADRLDPYVHQASQKRPIVSRQDLLVIAEARANNAEIWSMDRAFRKDPRNLSGFKVKVAPESWQLPLVHGKKPDYRVGRKLMRLGQVHIAANGTITRPPASGRQPKGTPSNGGGGGRPGTKAVVGVPSRAPVPHIPKVSPGAAKANAAELGLRGVNFGIQKINDAIQHRRMMEVWNRTKPIVEKRLRDDPSLGAVILFRYGRRKKQGGEHESPLEHVSVFLGIGVGYGYTQDEAEADFYSTDRLFAGAGMEVTVQKVFIPPTRAPDYRQLQTPFTPYGVGTFVKGREKLMRVSWKGVRGFDELNEVRVPVPEHGGLKFLLMLAPSKITFANGQMRHTTRVASEWRDAKSTAPQYTRPVSVVDLDDGLLHYGDDTAAMVFPANAITARAFTGKGETRDPTGHLRNYMNIDKMRWVRPENIHVVRKFIEDKLE